MLDRHAGRSIAVDDMASAPGTGEPIVAVAGDFPKLKNTVCADVLSRMLSGRKIRGLETVANASTTRLAARIHYLQSKYGWKIERSNIVVGCKDGRIATVSEYFLEPSIIIAAERIGAVAWCAEVRKARAHLRSKATEAKLQAARANAASSKRKRASSESQSDLFASHA